MEGAICRNLLQLDLYSLLHIFSFLKTKDKQNVAQVCKYSKNIVYHPCLWRNVCVVVYHDLSECLVMSLQQRKITRFMCYGPTDEDLSLLFRTIPNITDIWIRQSQQVSQEFFQKSLPTLNKLTSLRITQCCHINVELLYQDERLTDILSRLKSFNHPPSMSTTSFQELMKKCRSLEELEFYDCDKKCNGSFQSQEVLVEACLNLRYISFGSTMWFSSIELWKKALENLPLNGIDLAKCCDVTNEHIKLIADVATNLEFLDISSVNISNDTLIYTAKKLKNLKHFYFSTNKHAPFLDGIVGCSPEEWEVLYEVSKMKKLESLQIGLNRGVLTDTMIYSVIYNMANLRSLAVRPVGPISPAYAFLIGEVVPNLRSLTVFGHRAATGIGALCGALKNLTDLQVFRCNLTDNDVKEIASCVKLKHLKLPRINKEVTYQGLKHIALLKSLSSLDISSCSVGDKGISLLAKQLTQLQELRVSGRKITNHGK